MAVDTVSYGAGLGWEATISEGLRETDGWRGERALTLTPLGRNPFISETADLEGDVDTQDIDLLLLAEPHGMENPGGHYRVDGSYEISSQFPARGETSIRPGPGGLQLYPSSIAMWAPGKEWGDFTLDFRLRPATLRNNEVFFSWQGRNSDGKLQSVVARVENRRLVWEFDGFFRHDTDRSLFLRLVSPPLVPGEWRHHRIRFKRDTSDPGRSGASPGLLEYLVDGIPADMVHATPGGGEGTEPFSPRIGALSDQPLLLAPSFSGYIDEFRLASAYDSTPPAGGYSDLETAVSGKGRTNPVDSGYPGSTLTSVRVRVDMPGSTLVRFYARSLIDREEIWNVDLPVPGSSEWTELQLVKEPEDPTGFGNWYKWSVINDGNGKSPVTGRYFIVGYVLDPDPAADLAPVLSAMELEYEPRIPPRPPRDLRWERDNEDRIRISWSGDSEAEVSGWWLSWGPRPGDYAATTRDEVIRGRVWIPRVPGNSGERPAYIWPRNIENRIIYASVRAAWPEGAPNSADPPGPGDYKALSEATREINFRP